MAVEALAGGETIVFVGDGRSDFCVSAKADLLFATGRLQAHCRAEDISFIPFTNFTDVLAALRRIHDMPVRRPDEPAFALGL
jgi:2-hydroxy-3-keto-5-methylthiopentenyl-1-phosphate phosphatase